MLKRNTKIFQNSAPSNTFKYARIFLVRNYSNWLTRHAFSTSEEHIAV